MAHRFFAAALNHMREHGEKKIPVDVAHELATRVIAQREMPVDFSEDPSGWVPLDPEDAVHVPVVEQEWLRVLVNRFAYRHAYHVDRVVAVERRLFAPIQVVGPDGATYERTISGQLDVLQADPPDGAIVVDYKTGWAPPPLQRRPREEGEDQRLSDMGYAQQVIYGYLVLANYPTVQRVSLREFYVLAKDPDDEVRTATVERWQMERIADMLSGLVSNLDAAIDSTSDLLRAQAAAEEAGEPIPQGRWLAEPGTHCSLCPRSRDCPIRDEVGIPNFDDYEECQILVQEWHVAGEIRKERTPFVHGAVDRWGEIALPHAKGRKVVGYEGGSRRLAIYEPPDADESPFEVVFDEAS